MPVNRNALIRYKTIDLCLQNKYRKWTLDNLIDACSDALYEYEGIDKGVSKRTVQLDIQMMRSDKLGYNAPIIVSDKKYYTYADPDYSIMNIPLSEGDLNKLSETVEFLKQFKGFSHFSDMDTLVQKFEDHIYSQKSNRKAIIDFEKNENLRGIQYLEQLYQAIKRKNCIELCYKSFKAREASTFTFYPLLLKEFRNRWFLVGSKMNKSPLQNLAIDRILDLKIKEECFVDNTDFDAESHFKHVIGVSVNEFSKPEQVVLFITRKHAPYVITKPIHHSQQVLEETEYGIKISLDVQHNFELEKEILSLGDGILVLSPEKLRASITHRMSEAIDSYNTSFTDKGIISLQRKYEKNGFCTIHQAYSKRKLRQLGSALHKNQEQNAQNGNIRKIQTEKDPNILQYILPTNMANVIKNLIGDFSLDSITYHNKPFAEDFEFRQSGLTRSIEVIVLLYKPSIYQFNMQVIPGSHGNIHDQEKIDIITSNCIPTDCNLHEGSIIVINPALIKRISPMTKRKNISYLRMSLNLSNKISSE